MKQFKKHYFAYIVVFVAIVLLVGFAVAAMLSHSDDAENTSSSTSTQSAQSSQESAAAEASIATARALAVSAATSSLPVLHLETATTEDEQEQGLSDRASLGADNGMLFIFQQPYLVEMWMKDMEFPLDMIWLDKNMRIITIKEDATADSYPQTFAPDAPATYVIEVNNGYVQTHGLKVGDVLTDDISLDVQQ